MLSAVQATDQLLHCQSRHCYYLRKAFRGILVSAIAMEVSIRPRSLVDPVARSRVLVDERVDVGFELGVVNTGSVGESLRKLVGRTN